MHVLSPPFALPPKKWWAANTLGMKILMATQLLNLFNFFEGGEGGGGGGGGGEGGNGAQNFWGGGE